MSAELVLGIVGAAITVVGVFVAFLQLRRTPRGQGREVLARRDEAELATLVEIQELLDRHVPIFYRLVRDKRTKLSEGHEVVGLTRRITTLAHRCAGDRVRKDVLSYMEGSLAVLAVAPKERGSNPFMDQASEGVQVLYARALESVTNSIQGGPPTRSITKRS